jgi:dethiobiotin synthetase
MKGVFVTGTDTGVGKTVLTATLTALLRERGVDAVPAKPVQTGTGGARGSPDLTFCLRVAGVHASRAELELMSPYRYRRACSPHLAAREERRPVRLDGIVRSLARLAADHDLLVVEGAGGVFVPLGARVTNLDLMERLRLPVVVAARPGLGTINHTLLTVQALQRRRLPVLGVVLVQATLAPWGLIEADNLRTIEAWAGAPVLGRIPYAGDRQGRLSAARLRARLPVLAPHVRPLIEAVLERRGARGRA